MYQPHELVVNHPTAACCGAASGEPCRCKSQPNHGLPVINVPDPDGTAVEKVVAWLNATIAPAIREATAARSAQ